MAVIQGGEGEGADVEQAGKRKRRHKLAPQPVRHSLWEQDSLEAQNEVLAGHLEGEVRALKQRKAVYDEARRLSDGSDSCWSGADSDSDSVAELEVVSGPLALEGAVVVAAQEGELVGLGQGPLQLGSRAPAPAVLGKRVQREEVPLHPRGLAPKWMREFPAGQGGQGNTPPHEEEKYGF